MAEPYTDGEGEVMRAEHISPRKTGDNIQAKRVASYVWDGSAWQRMSQPGETAVKKTKIDKSSTTNVIYIGKANLGTALSAASWTITKIDKTVTDNITITHTGTTAVWNDRLTETYL